MESRRRVAAVVDATPSTDARCFPQQLHRPALKRDSVVGSSARLSAALRLACTSRLLAARAGHVEHWYGIARSLVQLAVIARQAILQSSEDLHRDADALVILGDSGNSAHPHQSSFPPFVPVAGVQSASERRCCLSAQTGSSGRAICRSEPSSACDWSVVGDLHCRGKPPMYQRVPRSQFLNHREPQRLGRHFRPMQRARVSPCLTLCARGDP